MNIPKLISFITTIGSFIPIATARFGQGIGKREISKSDNQKTNSNTVIAGNNSEHALMSNKKTIATIETVLGINIDNKPEHLTATINSFADKWHNIEASKASDAITNSDYSIRTKRSIKKGKYKNEIVNKQQTKYESNKDLSKPETVNKNLDKLTKHFKNSVPHKIEHDDYKFSLNIYSESEMQKSRLENIEREVSNTLKQWYQHYAPHSQHKPCDAQMFVFDDSESYNHFTAKHQIGSPGSGGSFNHIGTKNVILAFNQGFTYNVPHELTHALEYCNSHDLKFLSEGRAQYIQMLQNHELQASTFGEVSNNISSITNELIAKSCYLNKEKSQFNDYKLCAAVEAYLAKHNQNTFQTVSNDPVHGPKYLASKINLHDFKNFVETKATPAYMKKINALLVQCDKEIYAYQDRYGNQMHISKAVIQTKDGPVVASPISTTLYANSIRTTLADRQFYMDVDLEYRYLKLITHKGKKVLVFCNKYGQKFSDTTMYKNVVKSTIGSNHELTAEQKQNIKDDLTYLRPNNDLLQYSENTIFGTKTLTNNKHAVKYKVSILHDGAKITELPTAEIFCIQENDKQKYVIFRDPINDIHSAYADGSAYLGLVPGKDMYLLSGTPHNDAFINKKHVHYKPGFRMKPKDTFAPDQLNNNPKKLVVQNVIVKNDGEAKDTTANSQSTSSLYLERGKLLDNRGSDATHDDRHEALLKNAGNGKSAVISTESYHIIAYMDKNGKFTDKAFVIEQHGSTHHFQFPNGIDSLKLKKLGDSIVLVPCTKDGHENIPGMPEIPDELRYISADHLYTFKNPEYNPSRAIATGISNLSSYEDGTIFNIRMSPEAEKQCMPGHTCASYPVIQESNTDKTIGMLPPNYNIYVDNILNSINPNAAPRHQVYQQPDTVPVEQTSKNVFEVQQSKTALTNSNPPNVIARSALVEQYSSDVVDVPPNNLYRGKRSVDLDESHKFSDLYDQLHSDDVYSHNLFGESYDSDVSI